MKRGHCALPSDGEHSILRSYSCDCHALIHLIAIECVLLGIFFLVLLVVYDFWYASHDDSLVHLVFHPNVLESLIGHVGRADPGLILGIPSLGLLTSLGPYVWCFALTFVLALEWRPSLP